MSLLHTNGCVDDQDDVGLLCRGRDDAAKQDERVKQGIGKGGESFLRKYTLVRARSWMRDIAP
jgi:hypothetical protein